uniref:Fucosyltransferase n=1 Tax=Setaria digitata TaxID=48799 RepID=A0A915PM63_9BILA
MPGILRNLRNSVPRAGASRLVAINTDKIIEKVLGRFGILAMFGHLHEDYVSVPSPLILTWTTFFSQPWVDVIKKNIGNCSYHCIFTNDKKKLPSATAILFHIRDLEKTLPEVRDPKQLFVFVLHESPLYTFDYLDYVPADYFNLTMTYRHDSDIYIPYGMMKSITNRTAREQIWNWSEVVKIANSKRKLVLQMVSNCQTKSKRELYVEQLRTYINVTQHGRCNNSSCDEKCELQEAAQHRFYLAFENSICRDYVTEKLFKCFVQLLVPVVLEKSNYESILPPGSFIAADDFGSPRELAEYLSYLLSNNTAYLSKTDDLLELFPEKAVELKDEKMIAQSLPKYVNINVEDVQGH